jgi:O-antigen ligase
VPGLWHLAGLSIFLSLCAACVFRSRTAVLTTVISLTCITLLTHRRHRLATGFAALLALFLSALLLNALFLPNSQLIEKVTHSNYDTLSGRTPVWSAAWTLFLSAPVVGHGPHCALPKSVPRLPQRLAADIDATNTN